MSKSSEPRGQIGRETCKGAGRARERMTEEDEDRERKDQKEENEKVKIMKEAAERMMSQWTAGCKSTS